MIEFSSKLSNNLNPYESPAVQVVSPSTKSPQAQTLKPFSITHTVPTNKEGPFPIPHMEINIGT